MNSRSPSEAAAAAVTRLDEIARKLRRECPWDREQDERTIVPHTVEESYELAEAVYRHDDGKLLDELGDVLFQVHFLALLLEERGAGDLEAVAEHCVEKLIRRHPHVFGSERAESAEQVLRNWDQIKRGEEGREPGIFGDVPETLPALLYARKVQRRASGSPPPRDLASVERVREGLSTLESADGRDERFDALGDALFELVAVGRRLHVDPELALRAAADRFRERVVAEPGS
jgi:XTP/dITP diphosphohydrolase/tetrapyrrole methylase family protein/MazG family protein/ATP diphosphatase